MTSVLYDAPGPRARARSRVISVVGIVIILAGLALLVLALGAPKPNANGAVQPGLWDPTRWDVFTDVQVWRSIGEGVLATLRMAGVAAVIALVLGVVFSFARAADHKAIAIPAAIILEFVRGMPVLLMMLFILLVFSSGQYWAGVAALGLYNGAIIGEALRAGIQSLPRGQREAGLAIGLTPLSTRFRIEFPQAFRQMLPIIIAQLVVLLKDTSLAFVVGYSELLRVGARNLPDYFGNRYFFSFFLVVLVIYLAMNLSLSWFARFIARRSGPKSGKLIGPMAPEPIPDSSLSAGAGVGAGADGGDSGR
ncbi:MULTISPECIES: amino acid ABC transporter permease [Cryobacterium]|uniref:amino acid ABC transporter permease n=1 Tax=Cryobacterium TaxID=69578 RepID=UPI000CD487EA|nr:MULTISPECIES: amino acid ABC transporter permease [Cryobacterium]POH63054.1 polar amino acid ABC transporter permease [Cryobacterium zongtaii]TFC47528.1 amino acid ABC transporter permease [Cryobacterium sp. TMN-39-2]TFC54903.1 amino acid ABC transporter permease [Cryobacterium sp. TMB3-1-2]TFC70416.1 amino acid ABC transporter permease [Cryobacterium sp. TMB3-15]TFC75757.1 amino acid ABC transporter permease [Cryobacterium sp. TMB3-10]